MPLKKHLEDLTLAVLVPCYKRKEYTQMCVDAINKLRLPCSVRWILWDDGSNDDTKDILETVKWDNKLVVSMAENVGLRKVIQSFFHETKPVPDFYAKIDNDCIVPENYFIDMLQKFASTDADILSPNVFPSNAAEHYGKPDTEKKGYRPSKIVGGLWMMTSEMVDGVDFDWHDVVGIKGATNILYQIVLEKEPNIGWVEEVVVQDVGHWSGKHPDNIKSFEHYDYYREIGRETAWGV